MKKKGAKRILAGAVLLLLLAPGALFSFTGNTSSGVLWVMLVGVCAVCAGIWQQRKARSTQEQALSAKAQLNAVINSVMESIIVVDQQGTITSINAVALHCFGYSPDEVVGQPASQLLPAFPEPTQTDEGTPCQTNTAIDNTIETTGRRKNGVLFPLQLKINTDTVATGQQCVWVLRDLTEDRQISDDSTRQRGFIDAVLQAQGRFIEGGEPVDIFDAMLPHILRLTGSEFGLICELMENAQGHQYLKPYAISNISWDDASQNDYLRQSIKWLEIHNFDNLLGNVIRTGKPVISNASTEDERSGGTPKGHPPIKTYLGIPIYLGERLLGMFSIANRQEGYCESQLLQMQPVIDCCAQLFDAMAKDRVRQRASVALKRTNSFLSALISNVPDGILVEDEAGKIYAVNQVYCDLFGKQELSLMLEGEDCAQEFTLNHRQFLDPEAFLEWRRTCLSGGVVAAGREFSLQDQRVFQQGYVPIYFEDEQGHLHSNHIWTFHDVTPLRHAITDAQDAAKVKSQFLATMSHEIRTPMNGVLGMLHLLNKTPLDNRQKRFVDTATGSGEMLLRVINDILDFSKLEAGKLELENIDFDLTALVEDIVGLMARSAQDKGLELICSINPSVPRFVNGDPNRLRQILSNLIGNAIKFTEKGDVVVYVAPQNGQRIIFGVRDTGIGISEELQHRLFQAFSQMDSSHTRKYGGTGLGLAICQQLVNAMGGDIRAASATDLGSDFSFDLPLQAVKGYDDSPENDAHPLSQLRILIVGNSLVSRQVLHQIVRSWDVLHVEEVTIEAAFMQLQTALTQHKPFDVVLLDMQNEGPDGLALAHAIHTNARVCSAKLVMISPADCVGSTSDINAWLSKPVRRSELFSTVKNLMGIEQATTEKQRPVEINSAAGWFKGFRLLLVDDNPINQDVAKEILSDAGFTVDIRDNGLGAIQAIQEQEYDAVLMDVQMPVMDGLEATQRIRALQGRFASVPIFAMTANALSSDVSKSLAAGMSGHLTKPFKPEVVFSVLAHWLKPASQRPDTIKESISISVVSTVPSELPGLSYAEGLSRMCGNETAYRRILNNFKHQQTDSIDRLENLIHLQAWEEASHLAHSLKGSGGNLGAHALYQEATLMENACRKHDSIAAVSALAPLQASLSTVIDSIAQLDCQQMQPQSTCATTTDVSGDMALLNRLLTFLDSDLGEAQTCLETLQRQAQTTDLRTTVTDIEQALNSFDIETAKDITQHFIAAHTMPAST